MWTAAFVEKVADDLNDIRTKIFSGRVHLNEKQTVSEAGEKTTLNI